MCDARCLVPPFGRGQRERRAHAHHLMGRHRSGAQVPFLTTPVLQRPQLHATTPRHDECSDSFRSIGLVRRQRQQVEPHAREVQRALAHALRGIHVQAGAAVRGAQTGNRGNVLDDSDLVVDVHDGDQDGVRP